LLLVDGCSFFVVGWLLFVICYLANQQPSTINQATTNNLDAESPVGILKLKSKVGQNPHLFVVCWLLFVICCLLFVVCYWV
jgi:uncharacterized MAPEG superfamily protein